MQTIVRMTNKTLQVVSLVKTYQNEHNADEILFLLPEKYGKLNLVDCNITMYWKNKDDYGDTILLELQPELYNDTYLSSTVLLTNKFTQIDGYIELWLEIVNGDNAVVLKTNKIKIPILEHSGSMDAIPEGKLSLVDSLNIHLQQLDAEIQNIYNSMPTIEEIEELFLTAMTD